MTEDNNDKGVSPVIGVILMIAVTVILSAIIGVFVLDVSGGQENSATAGVSMQQSDDGVTIRWLSEGNSDSIEVYVDGSKVSDATLTNVGESVTVSSPSDSTISVVAVNSGTKTKLQSFVSTKDTGSVSVVSGDGGGGSQNLSTANSSAPDCSTVSYSGSGTSSDPYKVTNDHELQCISSNDLTAYYKLTQNIDASKTDQWNSGNGFKPVGEGNDKFSGTLDGNGYYVKGLYIDRASSTDIGLIGFASGSSSVKNIGIENPTVVGGDEVGTLIGTTNGSISNSYSTGGSVDGARVGGLVGYTSMATTYTTVTNLYSDTTVNATGGTAGGLIGQTQDTYLKRSYSLGNVNGNGNSNIGGLVGYHYDSKLINTYAEGDVSGDIHVGGLIGRSYSYDDNNIAEKSYATGAVSGNSEVGGLAGELSSSTLRDSYWDTSTTGQSTAVGNNSGTTSNNAGLTTSEMQGSSAESNMTAFDWSSVWTTGASGEYPNLQWEWNNII